ncbi:hypothetical protein M406DRAFT_353439 [Cryphonectria parasitica EP155]|uniref:Uncharacterized protein n=1 Tax=Cryphonectria parasitica (strain ATCC 38755 / EP155) TaxID=660469 RepID=A0A9P4XSP2_CRYP1|nr:uncharacterized protein M406DRAFT_353439 [Cryphonectria parasitica EP155]KAF3760584.1 hypothetical protein M406DRAFT_353439 [Cryphonectria parasitica EP155]
MLRQSRRLLWRSRGLIYSALASIFVCSLLLSASSDGGYRVIPWTVDASGTAVGADASGGLLRKPKGNRKPTSKDYDDNRARWLFSKEWNETGALPGAGAIYGKTLSNLTNRDNVSSDTRLHLTATTDSPSYTDEVPYNFNPYPKYDSDEWKKGHRADFVPCDGPAGRKFKDVQVFRGRPEMFPEPSFGSYDLFEIDPNLCYERDTRLGQYGMQLQADDDGRRLDWTKIEWGKLQTECAERNKARFDRSGTIGDSGVGRYEAAVSASQAGATADELKKQRQEPRLKERAVVDADTTEHWSSTPPTIRPENPAEHRTAILLRSYTGKQYTENDRHVLRSLITELSLRTGGQYQVYLLVQVKDHLEDLALWDAATYKYVLQTQVPKEFHDIAILWGSYQVQEIYPLLEPTDAATVHNAQWLSVQKFMIEHPEYDYVWNWEMDARVMGHHYDMLTKIEEFAKKQPRKGLWERNERFYIPSSHGDYDTTFRTLVEKASGKNTVWGPPDLPFIKPVGPKPPVSSPSKDNYEWGVGEEADLITLSPMFDPTDSNWILRNQVWQYNDTKHSSKNLPRRATIVTQSRLSRRLVEAMHEENKVGNHVGSEMAANTVALLHGLKAVYAPMPVFMDRPFPPESLQKWFNPGPGGVSGGPGSAMGWGLEHRFQGITWYYRSVPPQRMYNNWMGYSDANIGGRGWEDKNGRPCLQAMMLHPIKDIVPTWPGYTSTSDLPYNWWDDFRSDEEKAKDKKITPKKSSRN